MPKATFTVGAFTLIFDDKNRILLCHRRDYDFWNLPGGGLEKGEAPWDGAVREVKEETGLDVEIKDLVHVSNHPKKNDIVFLFTCKVVGGEITLNDEADKIEYFALEKIPHNTSPRHVLRIKDVLKNPNKVVTKTYTGKPTFQLIEEGLL